MIACVLLGVVGAVLVVLGLLVWKKQMISLFHEYHVDRVSEENKGAFCKVSGIGVSVIGAGLLISGILVGITNELLALIVIAIGFVVGLAMLTYSGKRYNR